MIGNFRMSTRLILRGARVDYVNKDGKTALNICVENQMMEQIHYLLYKNANPHIMGLDEQDSCDLAK